MEKTWFIFQEDHHLGPFSTSEIQELLEQEKISLQVPLWKEGIDDWYPLEHYTDFTETVVDEVVEVVVEEYVELALEEEEFPVLPDLPVVLNEVQVEEHVEPPVSVAAFEEFEFADEKINIVEVELPDLPDFSDLPEDHEQKEVIKAPETITAQEVIAPVISKKVIKEVEKVVTPVNKVSVKESSVDKLIFEEIIPSSEGLAEQEIKTPSHGAEDRLDDYQEEILSKEVDDSSLVWEELDQKKSYSKFNIKLWAAASICFLTVLGTYYILNNSSVSKDAYEGLLASQVEKISDIRSLSFSKSFQVKVFVSKNNKELILATNLPHEAKAYLTLSSVKKRVIGNGVVVVSANSIIKNGIAKFSKLSLVKGEKFLPGEYYVKVSTVPTGVKEKISKFLSTKINLDFFKPSKTHRFRGKDFIFQGTKEEFSFRLKAYFEKALEKKKTPYKDQLEKYRTFSQMSIRIFKIYEEVITSIRKGKDIESFELLYTKEAGPILQSLILDTHALFKKFELSNPSVSSSYEEVLEIGKKIGEMASDMVTMTQKKKRLRRKSRERLIKLFDKRSHYLYLEASGKAKDTEKLLNNLKL